ncbi:MAG: hypothetical protein ACC662_02770 [Planctomycetota bacterium]
MFLGDYVCSAERLDEPLVLPDELQHELDAWEVASSSSLAKFERALEEDEGAEE